MSSSDQSVTVTSPPSVRYEEKPCTNTSTSVTVAAPAPVEKDCAVVSSCGLKDCSRGSSRLSKTTVATAPLLGRPGASGATGSASMIGAMASAVPSVVLSPT